MHKMIGVFTLIISASAVFGDVPPPPETEISWKIGGQDARLDNPTNWNTGTVPKDTNIAAFNTIPPSAWTSPIFTGRNVNPVTNPFAPNLIRFEETNTTPYTFSISGPSTELDIMVPDDPDNPFVETGVENLSNVIQTFDITQGATLHFVESSPDVSNSGKVVYNISDSALLKVEAASFPLGDNSLGSPKIFCNDGSVVIDFASAGDAFFELTGSSLLLFQEEARGGNATIVAKDQSQVNFIGFVGSDFVNITEAATANITLFDRSRLFFGPGGFPSFATITMAGDNTQLVLAQPAGGELFYGFSGILQGKGLVGKTDDCLFNFWADGSGFSGTTLILDGIFALYSTLGGDLAVLDSGILTGTGTILGELRLHTGVTIIPGIPNVQNTPGTLSVHGDLLQQSHTLYQVFVEELGVTSYIHVGGPAFLDPEITVDVAALNDGVEQLAPNAAFTMPILHADGGVDGTYAHLITHNPLIAFSLSYDANNVFLHFTNKMAFLPQTPNQSAVATQLQSISRPTPDEAALLNALVTLPPTQAQRALDQLSGEQYSNVVVQSQLANQKFIQRLYNPVRTLIVTDPCCCAPINSSGLWMDSSYEHSCVHGDKKARGYEANGYEITVGGQTSCDSEYTLGGAASYENTHFDYNLGGRGKGYNAFGGVYGLYRPRCFYVLSDLTFGYSEQHLKRHVHVGDLRYHAKSTPKVYQGNLYVEGGVDVALECLLIQPFVGIEGGYFYRHSITEHHGSEVIDLSIASKSRGAAYSRLGVHMTTMPLDCVTVAVDLAWRYRYTSLGSSLNAKFQQFGSDFVVHGVQLDRNTLEGTIDFEAQLFCGLQLFAEASGQWSPNATSYNLLGGIKADW